MQAYLTLVTFVSLAGFYTAAVMLTRAVPTFILGVDGSSAIRNTLAIWLGAGTAAFALWSVHWVSLRRLWAKRPEDGSRYLFGVGSLGVIATAISGGRLVTQIATLLLSTSVISTTRWAELLGALFLFVVSWLLWQHHWGPLHSDTRFSCFRPSAEHAVSLPERSSQRHRQAA